MARHDCGFCDTGWLSITTSAQYVDNILKVDFQHVKRVLGRCLRLRCPACGESGIVSQPFRIRHHCPECLALFKREDGFFVGAILANVVTTELVILLVCFFFLLVVGAQYESVLVLLFVMALIFPVAFYHHAWSLWIGFDFMVESLPKYTGQPANRDTKHNSERLCGFFSIWVILPSASPPAFSGA